LCAESSERRATCAERSARPDDSVIECAICCTVAPASLISSMAFGGAEELGRGSLRGFGRSRQARRGVVDAAHEQREFLDRVMTESAIAPVMSSDTVVRTVRSPSARSPSRSSAAG